LVQLFMNNTISTLHFEAFFKKDLKYFKKN
jgi:hypothetical protein